MLDPEGPLPTSVYWRRRAAAAVGALVAMVLSVWALGALIGSAEPAPGVPQETAKQRVLSAQEAAAASSTSELSRSSAPQDASSLLPMPDDSAVSSVPQSPGASAGPLPSGASSAPNTPTHGKPLRRCAERSLQVDARVAKQDFRLGERPHLQMSLTNAGGEDCFVGMNRAERELIVLARGGKRVWSSADCYFGEPRAEIHRLRAGESIAYDLNWAARTSAPGCPVDRGAVPPGRYALVAKAAGIVSKPTPFVLHK